MSTQGGAGSWGEVWQYLGFAPTVRETKATAFFFLLESRGLIFFLCISLFISNIAHVLLSISVHLSQCVILMENSSF